MSEHPIEGLMTTAMSSIREMVDVDTIIGDPIKATNNIVIIPISKVSFGFAAGGSEFKGETASEYSKKDKDEEIQYKLPFGGGSGAGVSINPIAFLVIQDKNVKLLEEQKTPKYKCDCSRNRIEKGLISLGKQELENIINTDGKAEIKCTFCNIKYDFNKEELEKLKEECKK